jgi:DNA-binding XRE family transcriptional regulator
MAIESRFLYLNDSNSGELMHKAVVQRQLAQRQLKSLGETIRALRHSRQLSQEELAARANIHVTYLSAFECGKRNPSLAIFFSVAAALKVSPADLLLPSLRAKGRAADTEGTARGQRKRSSL